jgi:hypothetical protein
VNNGKILKINDIRKKIIKSSLETAMEEAVLQVYMAINWFMGKEYVSELMTKYSTAVIPQELALNIL